MFAERKRTRPLELLEPQEQQEPQELLEPQEQRVQQRVQQREQQREQQQEQQQEQVGRKTKLTRHHCQPWSHSLHKELQKWTHKRFPH